MGFRSWVAQRGARPVVSARRLRVSLALTVPMLAVASFGAATRQHKHRRSWSSPAPQAQRIPAPRPARAAIQALGAANGFTVDITADAAQINAANLAGYRAVVFVNSAGDVLNAAQEADLQSYVNGGGGFVGIGETAKLEEGSAARNFFNTLIGLTGAARTTAAAAAARRTSSSSTASTPRRADLRRCSRSQHRQLLHLDEQPDGPGPHRRPRPLQHDPGPDRGSPRESVTNDAVTRFTGTTQHAAAAAASARCPGAATSSRAARSTPASARRPRPSTTRPSRPTCRRHPVGRRHGPRQLQGDDQVELHARPR